MWKCKQKCIEEENLVANIKKTALYLIDALGMEDYESANLELEELKFAMKRLGRMQQVREKREKLVELVLDMKARGINIDFATRSSFFNNFQKNAVEESTNLPNKHKKKQQAKANCK